MLTIQLHNLLFYAYHGLLEEEKILGNDYVVNITLQQHAVAAAITDIQQCTNYADVYTLVAQRMQVPTPLLETLAQDICNLILQNFLLVDMVLVNIQKVHPPITTIQGSVSVQFELKRS